LAGAGTTSSSPTSAAANIEPPFGKEYDVTIAVATQTGA
jgi:hypothetical protein